MMITASSLEAPGEGSSQLISCPETSEAVGMDLAWQSLQHASVILQDTAGILWTAQHSQIILLAIAKSCCACNHGHDC